MKTFQRIYNISEKYFFDILSYWFELYKNHCFIIS